MGPFADLQKKGVFRDFDHEAVFQDSWEPPISGEAAVVPAQFYCDVNNNSMAPNNANFVNLGVKKPFEGKT